MDPEIDLEYPLDLDLTKTAEDFGLSPDEYDVALEMLMDTREALVDFLSGD